VKRPEGRAPAAAQLARLTQHWPGAVFYQRADFSIDNPDAKLQKLTGASNQATEPHRFWEWVHEADVEPLKRQCAQAATTPGGVTTTFRIRHAQSGNLVFIHEHREADLNESAQVVGYHVLWQDVSRQTLAEKRLTAAAQKAVFSAATAGFAHDFNNQMAGVLSVSDLLLGQLGAEDPKRPMLQLINRSATQATTLLQRLLNLVRGKTGSRQYLDLNQVVSDSAEVMRKVLFRRIQVQTELAPQPVPVYLDPVAFGRVVLNLTLNAAAAMPTGGTFTLRVSVQSTAPALKSFRGHVPPLPCACVSVQDAGPGIAARHLPHLFEPFFTTKLPTEGSGLGLYQARRFAEQHGGAISVESTEGAGATFALWLPQSDFTEAEKLEAADAQRPPHVLLVGRAGAATDKLLQLLRAEHFDLVITHTPERATELLTDPDNQLQGALIAATADDAPLLAVVQTLQAQKLSSRLALQLLSGDTAQMDHTLLAHANLVLGSDADPAVVIRKLKDLFTAPPAL
jgi:signal transduction histidine kinase